MRWTFRSKDVVVTVEDVQPAPKGYRRAYRLAAVDEASGFTQQDIGVGLEEAGYDDTIEAAIRMGAMVIGAPASLDALYTEEAQGAALKLIGHLVGLGRIPEDHIFLVDGAPHLLRLDEAGRPFSALTEALAGALDGLGVAADPTVHCRSGFVRITVTQVWPRLVARVVVMHRGVPHFVFHKTADMENEPVSPYRLARDALHAAVVEGKVREHECEWDRPFPPRRPLIHCMRPGGGPYDVTL